MYMYKWLIWELGEEEGEKERRESVKSNDGGPSLQPRHGVWICGPREATTCTTEQI